MKKHDTTTPPQAAAAPQRARKVPKSKSKSKRSCDGQMKLGVWFKNHKFSTMWYMYSDSRHKDYDKELHQVMNMIDVKFAGKVQSARIYHVGDQTTGPEVLAWKDGNWYSPAQR